MASIGNQKEALLKQIEGLRNKVTVDKILPLLERYDDLTVDDFRGRIPDELFEQLRNPQEAKAWNDIISKTPDDETGLRDKIHDITEFIKKYPDSDKIARAEILKKGYETDLVSMKIYAELEKSHPTTQKEIGHEIQRLSEFINKYPSFSKIDQAQKRKEELENRIDNSLWQRAWAQIVATNPANRAECESLLSEVNNFIDEYPVSPKLDDAISLKSELESKIANLDGEDKALDLEWKGLTQARPSTIAEYQSLISKVSSFVAQHPQWGNIAEAQILLQSLKSQLDAMLKKQQEEAQRQKEEEERRHAEEQKRIAEEKRRQEELLKKQREEVSKLDTNPDGNSSKKYVWMAIIALIVVLCALWMSGLFGGGKEEAKPVNPAVEDIVDESQDNQPAEPLVENDTPDKPMAGDDKPKKNDKPAPKANDKGNAKDEVTPPAPQIPDWVKALDKIDRKVKGGEIVKIDYTPDKYDPKKVIITVHYPNFSVDAMSTADRQTVMNLNKDIINQYRSKIPVDIKVISLDVNNKTIN